MVILRSTAFTILTFTFIITSNIIVFTVLFRSSITIFHSVLFPAYINNGSLLEYRFKFYLFIHLFIYLLFFLALPVVIPRITLFSALCYPTRPLPLLSCTTSSSHLLPLPVEILCWIIWLIWPPVCIHLCQPHPYFLCIYLFIFTSYPQMFLYPLTLMRVRGL